jgi:hypothetical protein
MYTLYYLLFNTVYIKNSPTSFELCYSLSSGTQLFITPAIDVWYSFKYMLGRKNVANCVEFVVTVSAASCSPSVLTNKQNKW